MCKSEINKGWNNNSDLSDVWFANEESKQPMIAQEEICEWETKVFECEKEPRKCKNVSCDYEKKQCQKQQGICNKCGRKIKPRHESVKSVLVRDQPVYRYEKIIYYHNVIHIVPVIVKKAEKHIYKHEYKIEKQVIQEKNRFDEDISYQNLC